MPTRCGRRRQVRLPSRLTHVSTVRASLSTRQRERRTERWSIAIVVMAAALVPPLEIGAMMRGTHAYMLEWEYRFNALALGFFPAFAVMNGAPVALLLMLAGGVTMHRLATRRGWPLPIRPLSTVLVPWLLFTAWARAFVETQPFRGQPLALWLGWLQLTAPSYLVVALAAHLLLECRPRQRVMALLLLPLAICLSSHAAATWGASGGVFHWGASVPRHGDPQ